MERNNPAYLAWIRTLPCCECGAPAEPHHFKGEFHLSGAGLKAPDLFAVPLCRDCHSGIHLVPDRDSQREWLIRTWIKALELGIICGPTA